MDHNITDTSEVVAESDHSQIMESNENDGPLDLSVGLKHIVDIEQESFALPLILPELTANSENPTTEAESVEVSALKEEIISLQSQLATLNNDCIALKQEFNMYTQRPITSNFFAKCQNSDKWMQVYTSRTTAKSFEINYNAVSSAIPENNNYSLCKRQQLFLTLVRLSHNLSEMDLAFRFNVSSATVCRYFHSWIDAIYLKLRNHVIIWPTLDELNVAMPMCFRRSYPRTVSIMDCFETQIQIPHNRNNQAATYSTYKSRNTVKYLISTTPHGTVNFISKGYAGRKSDQFVVRHSGYKENLKEGDGVLADKGFDVAEEIGLMGATLTTPAFKLSDQLTQKETEVSRGPS